MNKPIVFVIVTLIFVGFFYKQSTKDSKIYKNQSMPNITDITLENKSDWKIYKNDLYEISYPWDNAEVLDRPSMPNFTQGFPYGKNYKSLKIISSGDSNVSYIEIQSYIKNDYGDGPENLIRSIFSEYFIRSNESKKVSNLVGNELIVTNPNWPRNKETGGLLMFVTNSSKHAHIFFTGVDYELNDQNKPIPKDATIKKFYEVLETIKLID